MLYGHMYSVLLCCSSQWCEFFRNASRSGRIIHGDTIAVLTPEFVFFIPYCVHVSREVSGHSSKYTTQHYESYSAVKVCPPLRVCVDE